MKIFAAFAMVISMSTVAEGIDNARSEVIGTPVTVEGFVTVPSGQFSGSTFDQGFAIEDSQAGIYISVATNPGL
ncbi:MAG: hypothetical protein ACI8WB_002004 [Phenylobacterium sp.]|jgi:hypothetical protein